MTQQTAIIVFSHLRWDWVYQRPQHLLSRLARDRRVLFIEEPLHAEDGREAHWKCIQPASPSGAPEANVTVCNPFTPLPDPGFSDHQIPTLRRMVAELIEREGLQEYIVWFYTPMALPLLESLKPKAVVFDCMDELSLFKNAPPQLLDRESELYRIADVVFTGGPSLYKAKKARHPNVHCFPSSVDAAHFRKAIEGAQDPDDQASLPEPRLGFFGVIDERLDLQLLDALATARPDWQIVMVGPVIKIDPAGLPRRPNLHYLGQRPYESLPGFLGGWDVCLLPFALNDATRFISPTKTLEYMAAEKPIVSTPITDVAEPYGDIVLLADNPEAFIAACDKALAEDEAARQHRIERMRGVLARTSWDATAAAMAGEIDRIITGSPETDPPRGRGKGPRTERRKDRETVKSSDRELERAAERAGSLHLSISGSSPPTPAAGEKGDGRMPGEASRTHSVVVIGAGPTGLSAAYHGGHGTLLLEKNDTVGGWCRSITQNGFTWDHAGHIMFSKDPYVHQLYRMLLGDNVHWQDREAWIYSKNVYTRYPFQGALYGLPPQVIKECIIGAVEARYGSIKDSKDKKQDAATVREGVLAPAVLAPAVRAPAAAGPHVGQAAPAGQTQACSEDPIDDCCGDGVMESTARLVRIGPGASGARGKAGRKVDGRRPSMDGEGLSERAPTATGEPANFEEFIYKVWGAGIARHFAIPYNRKLWAVPLTEMETSWLGGRVPLPDLEEMIEGALQPVPKPMGPNARFGYPLRGGFQALMNGFLPYLRDRLRLRTRVKAISPSAHMLTLDDGTVIAYDYLISTMPLPLLIKCMHDEAPQRVQRAAAALRSVSVRCVNLGIGREKLTEKHWIYYPEETVFHRIFVQGNASPHCNPPGGFGLTCEITYSPSKPLPCDGDDLIQRCIEDCHRVGIFKPEDPVWAANQVDLPHAYVVYDHERPRLVKLIREWLNEQDIILAGRYSEWEYYNSDHAFLAGKKAAETVRQLQQARSLARAVAV